MMMRRKTAKVFVLRLGLFPASTLVQAFHPGGWQRRFATQLIKPTNSYQTNGGVSSAKWIESVFGGMQPSLRLVGRTGLPSNSNEEHQCIIDNPATTLANPLLGVDLVALTKKVLDTACKPPGCRTKPLLVTVRGTGGGKTRLLEEIRRDLQRRSSVVPIAITFNGHTRFDDIEFRVPSAAVSAALTIVARMASAFYGQPFQPVLDEMLEALPRLRHERNAINLYTAFVLLMRQQMQDAGCPVEIFVLMIDETVRLQSQLLEMFPDDDDPLSDLRSVLLNDLHNAALVLSSLETEIKGADHPGRPFTPLLLCEAFDPHEIVTRWWGITDSQLQQRFKLIAAVLCDLPRALELTNTCIQHHHTDIAQPSFAAELMQNVKELIQERYPAAVCVAFPSPPLLRAMLFKSKYQVDREVTLAIRASRLTNVLGDAIKRVSMKRDMPVMVIPRLNLFLLASGTGDPTTFPGRFLEMMRHVIYTTVLQSNDGTGDLLGMHTALMLNARVGVSMYSGSTVTLAELLGLGSTGVHSPLRTKIVLAAKMARRWTGKVKSLKYRSNEQASKFLEEIQAIEVNEHMPIALRFSATGDNFGTLVKVYDAATPAKCHYVVLEAIPQQEPDANLTQTNANKDGLVNDKITPKEFPEHGKLAKEVCAVMAQLNATTTYAYFTTHDVQQAVYKPPLQPNTMWVYGGRDGTQKFMGPLWDLHRTYREGLLNPSNSSQQKD